MSEKTFRVPKRVREQAKYGLDSLETLDGVPSEALQVANMLMSGNPVGAAVPRAMHRYFSDNIRGNLKIPVAQMYGGKAGREWSSRCSVVAAPLNTVTAAVDPMERPPWDLTDDEVDNIIAFAKSMVGKTLEEAGDLTESDKDVIQAAEDVGESVEKLQEASTAGEELAQDDFEQLLAEAAIVEVTRDPTLAEFADAFESAKSRIEQAAMARRHRELAARMAGATTFQGAPILPIGDEVGRDDGEEGGAGPKV